MRLMSTMPGRAVLLVSNLATMAILQAAQAQGVPSPSTPMPQGQWGPGQWGPGHMWNDGYGWHFFWGGPFMMLLTVAAFVWVVRLLFGHARWRDEFHAGGRNGTLLALRANESALRILNERFARGEIQKDEYEEKKATLLA